MSVCAKGSGIAAGRSSRTRGTGRLVGWRASDCTVGVENEAVMIAGRCRVLTWFSLIPRPDYFQLVDDAMHSFDAPAEATELAYLLVTSKPDAVIRDRLAFQLQQRLGPQRIVAREWSEGDGGTKTGVEVAVLSKKGTEAVIRLKTRPTVTLQVPYMIEYCAILELQQRRTSPPELCLYLVLTTLVEHPWNEAIPALDEVIWYDLRHQQRDGPWFEGCTREDMIEAFPPTAWTVRHGKVRVGQAFGTSVSLLYWVCKHDA